MRSVNRPWTALAVSAILLLLLPLPPLAATPLGDTVFVRLPAGRYDPEAIPSVRALDYGAFAWLELTPDQYARLAASGVPYQLYENATELVLPGASFDTRHGEPAIAPGLRAETGPAGLYLVQLVGPVRPQWLPALRARGLTLVHYLAPFTYVVWGDGAAVEAAAGLDFVRWTGPYHPAYKLSPQVRFPQEEIRGYGLVLYPAGLSESLARLHAWGGRILGQYPAAFGSLEMVRLDLAIGPQHLEDLAGLPNLYAITVLPAQPSLRDEMSDQIVADNHPGGVPVPGYLAWLAGKGLDGSGVTVAIVDTGSDYSHTDLGSDRLQACLDYSGNINPPPACSGNNWCASHGTMTAAIAVGDGDSGVGDGQFLYGLGMAPESMLIVQNALCGNLPPPGGYRQLSRDTVVNGGYVQGNSWGPNGTPQGYDADTREFDFMPRDANPDVAGVEPMLFSLSIMNGGGGYQTQGTPDEAKNLLRVGGSKNYRAGSIGDLCT
jgi:serine protease AprX